MLVVGFGYLADIWTPRQLPVALSVFNMVPFCGPAAGYVHNLAQAHSRICVNFQQATCFELHRDTEVVVMDPVANPFSGNFYLSHNPTYARDLP